MISEWAPLARESERTRNRETRRMRTERWVGNDTVPSLLSLIFARYPSALPSVPRLNRRVCPACRSLLGCAVQ